MAKLAGRRTAIIIASVGLAGVAAFALTSYVRAIEVKAIQGTKPVLTFVAKDTIPSGTKGRDAISGGLISRQPVPFGLLIDTRIKTLEEIENRVSQFTIFKGQQVLSPAFADAVRTKGLLPIPADRQAMSVEVSTPPGVASFVQPGDQVSIVAMIDHPTQGPRVGYLLQNVEVLAVGQRTSTDGDRPANSQQQQKILFTLALTSGEVEKLALAIFQGQVYFTLLPPDQPSVQSSGRTVDNLFS